MTSMKTFYYCGASACAPLANRHLHKEASLTTTRPAQTILKSSAAVSLKIKLSPMVARAVMPLKDIRVVTRSTKMKAGQEMIKRV